MKLELPQLSLKARLASLILFLVLILVISGHFLYGALNENIKDIETRSGMVQRLVVSTEAVQMNGQLYYPLRNFLYDPTEQHRNDYATQLNNLREKIERLKGDNPAEYAHLMLNMDRLMILAEGDRSRRDIMSNSEATDASSALLVDNDVRLKKIKLNLEERLKNAAELSIYKAEVLHFIPIFYVIGGLAILGFVILIAMMDIFRPMSHVTRAMISASHNPRLSKNYMIKTSRRDEIGDFINAFNRMISEIADNIVKVEQKERQLMESWRYLQAVMDNVVDGLIIVDERGVIESFNPRAQAIFGYSADEVVGMNFRDFYSDRMRNVEKPTLEDLLREEPRELEARRKDGLTTSVELTVGRAQFYGRAMYIAAVRDISVRRQMEALLEQTQRMETVSRMTGGVAHDFNNMLTVISGSLELIERRGDDAEKRGELVASALDTVEKGRELTQRLLAFSRKQILRPHVMNVNDHMERVVKLVRSALQENIEIRQHLDENLWPVNIDSNQLDSAILNLAINARDAINGPGFIDIRTENVTIGKGGASGLNNIVPGDYVIISLTDNGHGIPKNIQSRVFDPFFTTKDVGKGTGLGLSMVYGFARQSGGYAAISQTSSRGTTISMYFPRVGANENMQAPEAPRAADAGPAPRGTETLLLVEDEPQVLNFMAEVLEELGYNVMIAHNGPEAVQILNLKPALDMVITDVVMPGGMNGEDVAARVHEVCPAAKILYISGYTYDALLDQGHLKQGVELLSKPFSRLSLAHKLREMLDQEKAA